MDSFKAIVLENTKLGSETRAVFEECQEAVANGRAKPQSIRPPDFRRWSYVLGLIRPVADEIPELLDVGVGLGQFATIASQTGWFKSVRGADRMRCEGLDESRFALSIYDITTKPSREMRADIVTCMECIEHIPDPEFGQAVANLKLLARKRLIVTVHMPKRAASELPSPALHNISSCKTFSRC